MCQNRVTLAECPGLGSVLLCSCGCVQLTLGPVTVRLQPEALEQATVLLQIATRKHQDLQRQQEDPLDARWSPANQLLH